MKKFLVALCCMSFLHALPQETDSAMVRRIYDHFLTKSDCYGNLEYLCTRIGHRLSGSPQAEAAVEWTRKAMYEAGAGVRASPGIAGDHLYIHADDGRLHKLGKSDGRVVWTVRLYEPAADRRTLPATSSR